MARRTVSIGTHRPSASRHNPIHRPPKGGRRRMAGRNRRESPKLILKKLSPLMRLEGGVPPRERLHRPHSPAKRAAQRACPADRLLRRVRKTVGGNQQPGAGGQSRRVSDNSKRWGAASSPDAARTPTPLLFAGPGVFALLRQTWQRNPKGSYSETGPASPVPLGLVCCCMIGLTASASNPSTS